MHLPRRLTAPLAALTVGVLLAGCSSDQPGSPSAATGGPPPAAPDPAPAGAPALQVEVVADGLDHPWDVAQAPDGTLLVDERDGRLSAVLPDGTVQQVQADMDDLFADGETGLMGLVLDPDFAGTRTFYTCQGITDDDGTRIAVLSWTVSAGWTTATRGARPVLDDIPVNEASGRHGGCRLRIDPTGQLLVGTGDNALGTNPQDLTSLAGKVLRLDPRTGQPSDGNPFLGRSDVSPYLWTTGHRNVQGLAVQPGTGTVFAAEQGTDRDDEVTQLRPGGNGGYDPVGQGVYDESVPMTDPETADVLPAAWASGEPTIAVSGATFLDGPQWGSYDGLLLLGVQKDTGVLALRLDGSGGLVEQFRLPELEDSRGRIRTVQTGVDGALYVTTDNGGGADEVLRVTPAG
ncbi:PQQ-dependent sugar dehydrogenase [Modestobacter sp. I12A-02628]|uniref:PQQ-dependent sugar dehydrogenase n=1 Tax=Goekera deserti TaxID=2497753 RepID=A0A7K3W8Z0_9ACTN|nr:PQQ-dependent sugar dehydrogenase [Goekera deserti]MPR00565.1 PQQ-dependent sugar dehydrogenase [Goekera deserti]NDI50546.1 PQQ-dependent sugar dehydrogenase [Goekera deserti]NEL52807.1 PQQ-dependent sugar dehydrogenase [Goekera deserti]